METKNYLKPFNGNKLRYNAWQRERRAKRILANLCLHCPKKATSDSPYCPYHQQKQTLAEKTYQQKKRNEARARRLKAATNGQSWAI